MIEFFVSGWRDERRRSFAITRYRQATDQLHRLLQHGVRTGEFHPRAELMAIVQGMFTFLDALQQSRFFLGPDILEVDGQIALVKDFLRFTLGVPSPSAGDAHR